MNKVGQMGRLFVSAGLLSFLAISVAQAKTVFPGHLVADEASNLAAKASDGSMTVFFARPERPGNGVCLAFDVR
ncbi:MAG: hypothetical protein WDO73_24135 [Ignavibacteriota bacterium]